MALEMREGELTMNGYPARSVQEMTTPYGTALISHIENGPDDWEYDQFVIKSKARDLQIWTAGKGYAVGVGKYNWGMVGLPKLDNVDMAPVWAVVHKILERKRIEDLEKTRKRWFK